MARVFVFGVLLLVAAVFWKSLREVARGIGSRRAAKRPSDASGYEWEPKTDQLYRRVKSVSVPGEDREAILGFLSSRHGVEAYMEPRTLMYPLTVVLVAADGEWARFQLRDDSFIRGLTGARGLQVYDAGKVGYPERMKGYRRDPGRTDSGPN